MNILVLNLPFGSKIIRRYSCSYYARGFLYPPEELLRVATIIKEYSENQVFFLDSIAEKRSVSDVLSFIKSRNIQLVITLLGIDFVHKDYKTIRRMKKAVPGLKIAGIGYMPSRFKDSFQELDFVLDNLFEQRLFDALKEKDFLKGLKKSQSKRLEFNPDIISSTNRNFVRASDYSELFCRGKTAFLYYAFGCSFHCSYCIHSYDLKPSVKRDKGKVLSEILEIYKAGYKNIRFLDDNITQDIGFLADLRDFVRRKKIKLNFYGLSRIDLINSKTVALLKEINFKRLYIGLETFSPEMQKLYKKNIDVDFAGLRKKFSLLRKNGIETGVWILYSPMHENKNDIADYAKSLRKLKASLVNISIVTPYIGTELFEDERESIRFRLMPFVSEFTQSKGVVKVERCFWISYLASPWSFLRYFWLSLKHPVAAVEIALGFISFGRKDSERKDFI